MFKFKSSAKFPNFIQKFLFYKIQKTSEILRKFAKFLKIPKMLSH